MTDNINQEAHPIKTKVVLLQAVACTALVVFSLLNIYLNPYDRNLGSYLFTSSTLRWAFTLTFFFLPLFLGILALISKNTKVFLISIGACLILSLYPSKNHTYSPLLLILSGIMFLIYVEFGHAVIRFFYFDISIAKHGATRKEKETEKDAKNRAAGIDKSKPSGELDVNAMIKRYFRLSPLFFGITLLIVIILYLTLIFIKWISPTQLSSSLEVETVYGLAVSSGAVLLIILMIRLFLPDPSQQVLIKKE
ncbi:MAG: hypothetical protein QW728_02075 [Thermoplasmata archaeon]